MAEAEDYMDKIVKEYRFKPTAFMFGNLVKGYAKHGDMDRCFALYNQVSEIFIYSRDAPIQCFYNLMNSNSPAS